MVVGRVHGAGGTWVGIIHLIAAVIADDVGHDHDYRWIVDPDGIRMYWGWPGPGWSRIDNRVGDASLQFRGQGDWSRF